MMSFVEVMAMIEDAKREKKNTKHTITREMVKWLDDHMMTLFTVRDTKSYSMTEIKRL